MVWGCMSAYGVGELVFIDEYMDKLKYLQILKENLKKSAENMGILDTYKFYQDNDPNIRPMMYDYGASTTVPKWSIRLLRVLT